MDTKTHKLILLLFTMLEKIEWLVQMMKLLFGELKHFDWNENTIDFKNYLRFHPHHSLLNREPWIVNYFFWTPSNSFFILPFQTLFFLGMAVKIRILCIRSAQHLRAVFAGYPLQHKGHTIQTAIKKNFSGQMEESLLDLCKSVQNRWDFIAELYEESMHGIGTREKQVR